MVIDTKQLFCAHCGREVKGDTWYAGRYISYTHADDGRFMCDLFNFDRTDHAEPIK